jgi:hypothetical protein
MSVDCAFCCCDIAHACPGDACRDLLLQRRQGTVHKIHYKRKVPYAVVWERALDRKRIQDHAHVIELRFQRAVVCQ